MVMRVMLIGLLVIGPVAMLETDVNAGRRVGCDGWVCPFVFTPQLTALLSESQENLNLLAENALNNPKVVAVHIRGGDPEARAAMKQILIGRRVSEKLITEGQSGDSRETVEVEIELGP